MYKIAICDDDPSVRRSIRSAIAKAGIPLKTEEYEEGTKLIENAGEYDILFLDIDMPGINGIDTAVEIRKANKKVKIIYVTGYAEYIHRSFLVHPFAFLVKPVSEKRIKEQLLEAVSYYREKDSEKDAEDVTARFDTSGGIEDFRVKDIYYLEYQNRKIRLVTKKGDYKLDGRITDYAEKMSEYGFACPHKSFTVNLYYVKSIKGYDIHMLNGDVIPLSQKRSVQFRNILGHFQAGCI